MCLAIPVKLAAKEQDRGWVKIGDIQREISLAILPEAKVGDYVLVHAGFAISKVEEKEAQELFELLSTIK
ncbi:HypC/HybG/HupF family hydrogenase formation chaperone [Candidatus Aerophobetes bacterium]|nr:HypC/HybG/HupF family hydrogenase formation chaperone [Candidatus Aerophobetes bacterium]